MPPSGPTANFVYGATAGGGAGAEAREGVIPALSIFADRAHLRGELCEDAQGAGLRVAQMGDVAALHAFDAPPLGDIVVVDCPEVDGARLAALMLLDVRARQVGARLLVSTSLDALDAVFGCLDQSDPQILVNPTRAERMVALGHALAALSGGRVRELSEEDRLVLLRLSEQVSQIAQRLNHRTAPDKAEQRQGADDGDAVFRFESPRVAFAQSMRDGGERLARAVRPGMPDPRKLRQIIRQRQLRAQFFDDELFADPAWDMLLDLAAARVERARVSVSSLCVASGVPPTTALRWIRQMTNMGLFQRVDDDVDRRRAFITLTDKAADAMARYFEELASRAVNLV